MKRTLYFLLIIGLAELFITNAQPFGPPLYIADPVNMKCKYYFAGDQKHFNPRPENYTINIGYTTDFKSESQACEFFRCVYTNGTILVDENKKPIEKDLCICPEDKYWNNETGCLKKKLEYENTSNNKISSKPSLKSAYASVMGISLVGILLTIFINYNIKFSSFIYRIPIQFKKFYNGFIFGYFVSMSLLAMNSILLNKNSEWHVIIIYSFIGGLLIGAFHWLICRFFIINKNI